MDISLRGRTAMITGASKGLGLAMATRFAASGADVALLARRPEVLAEAKAAVAAGAKGKVAVFPCDVAKAADIERAYKGAMEVFGKIDILVNNAGESKAMPFATITDEVWQADLDLGAAELAVVTALDLAAELLRHRLLAVADAEQRHARLIDRGRGERRILVVHRGRAA